MTLNNNIENDSIISNLKAKWGMEQNKFAIEHFLPDFHPPAISVHLEEHLQFKPILEILGRLKLRNIYNSSQDLMTA